MAQPPAMQIDEDTIYQVTIETDRGPIVMELDPRLAPNSVNHFVALSRAAIATGATALTLEVRSSNTVAQELYRRFGFAPAGVRKGYYADTGEDALIMWAHDTDGHAFAERLDAIAKAIPGGTSVEPAA